MSCKNCGISKAVILRPKTGLPTCKECFFTQFESEIHETIVKNELIKANDRIAIAVSGGKDSTVLAHVLFTLNNRYKYGAELFLLSVDEGIAGYRDRSLEIVRMNQNTYGLDLKIIPFSSLVGCTMDEIAKQSGNSNCTFCGVFRRRALIQGASSLKCDKIATGHNADDLAETVLLNLIRGDANRFFSCVNVNNQAYPARIKPLKYAYEKEIVLYAFHKKLPYFSTECTHAQGAHRGYVRTFIKEMERIKPTSIINIIEMAESYACEKKDPIFFNCQECSEPTSTRGLCMMCNLKKKLEFS